MLSVFTLFTVFASIKFINGLVLKEIEAETATTPVGVLIGFMAAIALLFIGGSAVESPDSGLKFTNDLRETAEPEWRPAWRPARLKRGAKLQCLRCNKKCLHRK